MQIHVLYMPIRIRCDLGMWFPISSLYLAFNDFAFFKHSFYRKRRLLKRVPYLFIFVIRENEILIAVIRDSLFFLFGNRARDPPPPAPCTTLLRVASVCAPCCMLGIVAQSLKSVKRLSLQLPTFLLFRYRRILGDPGADSGKAERRKGGRIWHEEK